MYLKKASWCKEEASSSSPTSTAVDDLISSLNKQRLYREVTLALRTGLRDAAAHFSFLRVRGLRNLLKVPQIGHPLRLHHPPLLLRPVPPRDDESVSNLDHLFSVEPVKITSPSTDTTKWLSPCDSSKDAVCFTVRVQLSPLNAMPFRKHYTFAGADGYIINQGVLERGACLDALISILLDSSSNQMVNVPLFYVNVAYLTMEFEACHGIEKIAELIKDKQVDDSLRLKCGEFLLLLIGHLNGKERPTMIRINDEIPQLLGEKSASMIWAASQFVQHWIQSRGRTALHIHAGRVLESLELE
ncbi:hypothetical protein Syun_013451 [Stephania yunnanensis]|uniref:Uncharacterized protein n=1 Tax=Stephania yunnanensis TaxID=152371 RepID=A0AAP0K1I3_9MAGN